MSLVRSDQTVTGWSIISVEQSTSFNMSHFMTPSVSFFARSVVLFSILVLAFFLASNQVARAQLVDTLGAVSIGSDMAAGQAQPAAKQAPKIGEKGKIGELNRANAERNAQIEGEAGGGGEAAAEDENAQAAEETPQEKPAAASGDILQRGWWGPGGYVSPTKLGLYVLIFFIWTFCASWMNADMERLDNPNRETNNLIYLGLYGGVGLVFFFVPLFWASFPITVALCLGPPIIYVMQRNKPLPPHEKVLTRDHLWYLFAVAMNKIGVKVKVKPRLTYESGPPIEMEPFAKNVDSSILKGRLIVARNAPGYNTFRQNVFDAVNCRATALMFDFTPERTVIRHQVDGTWLDLEPIPRTADKGKTKDGMEEMLESIKLLVGANPNDRRSRQSGSFLAAIGPGKKKKKYEADFLSQGTKTGEAAVIQFTAKKVPFQSLDALGMRPEMQTKLLEQFNGSKGLFIVSALPANGLRSSMDVFSRSCDRFTRDVVNIEDVMFPTEEIENIILAKYDSSKGETPMKVLPEVVFKEPHALIIRDMTDLETLEFCCKEIDKPRLFITTTRAKDGLDAVSKFLAMKISPQTFLPRLNGMICQRLIRKLCPDCKEPYQPAPQLLQQLGLRPDQVKEFYRTRTPLPEPEERKRGICETCNGVGYYGRTALFELTLMTDSIRALILSNTNHETIRQQLLKEGQTGFLFEGINLLLKGETTVEEFSRIMKS